MSASSEEALYFVVGDEYSGDRLDKVLAQLMPSVSRARLQTWIEQGAVTVNGEVTEKIRTKVVAGDEIEVLEQPSPEELAFKPVQMPLDVVYDLNGLLARNPELKTLPRAGIVHRLDRDTTGLMVVAKTLEAQTDLIRQLQARTVKREYWAIVHGQAPQAGFIDEPIMRDPRSPIRFCVGRGPRAKEAKTHVRLVDFAFVPGVGQTPLSVSWVACRLDTGRTHQIRVHMQWAGFPLVGDPLYKGKMSKLPEGCPLSLIKRQALHASRLGLEHPRTKELMQWFVPAPDDLAQLMTEIGFAPTDEPVSVFEK